VANKDKEQREAAKERIRKGDYTGAEKIYESLRKNNPMDLVPVVGLMSVYLKQNKPQKAIAMMELEEDKFKTNPLFYKNLCTAYRIAGDKDMALRSIEKAIHLDPENARYISSRGYTYWFFSDSEKATQETERALEQASKNPDDLTMSMIENNLAYYYAEAQKEEAKARKYATFAYKNRSTPGVDQVLRSYWIHTYGYVRMRFAEDIEEIDAAIDLLNDALREGMPRDLGMPALEEAYRKRETLQ
jgi:tetratricopeptide (TPR) repeat protein